MVAAGEITSVEHDSFDQVGGSEFLLHGFVAALNQPDAVQEVGAGEFFPGCFDGGSLDVIAEDCTPISYETSHKERIVAIASCGIDGDITGLDTVFQQLVGKLKTIVHGNAPFLIDPGKMPPVSACFTWRVLPDMMFLVYYSHYYTILKRANLLS